MQNIRQIPTGMIQGNCYVVGFNGVCYIIDPGDEPQKIISFVEHNYQQVKAILLTHGHFDHCGAVDEVAEHFHCKVYMDLADMIYINTPTKPADESLFGEALTLKTPIVSIDEFKDDNVLVLKTPGHSPGSVSFIFKDSNAVFTGDCLFKSDIGRIDLPGGNYQDMLKSLKLLATLPDNYRVFPGHEEIGTMQEMAHGGNPYISRYR